MMHTHWLLEKALDMPVRDEMWAYLVKKDFVKKFNAGRYDINELADTVREIMAAGGQKYEQNLQPEESDTESVELQSWALSLLLAKDAINNPEVTHFRQEDLSGKLLPEKEVDSWIKEQSKKDGPATQWEQMPVNLPIPSKQQSCDTNTDPSQRPNNRGNTVIRCIEYRMPGIRWKRIHPIAAGGVLERLWILNETLTKRYRWEPDSSSMFVLVGIAPKIKRIESRISTVKDLDVSTRITMIVDPTTTVTAVADQYEKRRKQILKRKHRSLSSKHLQLAIFLAERPEKETWEQKRSVWNRLHPRNKYVDRRNFTRDAIRAREKILHPDYELA